MRAALRRATNCFSTSYERFRRKNSFAKLCIPEDLSREEYPEHSANAKSRYGGG